MERKIVYFEESGPKNTEATFFFKASSREIEKPGYKENSACLYYRCNSRKGHGFLGIWK